MSNKFDISRYIETLGGELISAFEKGGLAQSPGEKGGSRENAVHDKLRQLLPSGVGIGSELPN